MSKKQLFLTKPLGQLLNESKETGGLKRTLTSLNLTTLGIGAIIGAGIFVLTGQAAASIRRTRYSFVFCGSGWLAGLPDCVMLNLLQ